MGREREWSSDSASVASECSDSGAELRGRVFTAERDKGNNVDIVSSIFIKTLPSHRTYNQPHNTHTTSLTRVPSVAKIDLYIHLLMAHQ